MPSKPPQLDLATINAEQSQSPVDDRREGVSGWGHEVAPTGWVTIVCCDVSAVTELLGDLRAETEAALTSYVQLAESLLQEHNGYEVRRQGDTIMCAFSSVVDATNWCFAMNIRMLSLQDAADPLLRHPATRHEIWTEQGDPDGGPGADCVFRGLRLRMGMHTGKPYFEIEKSTGKVMYYGPVVYVAAGLASLAQGGQLLISQKSYQDLAPYCWPDDDNPVARPPVVDLLGWRQLRDRDEGLFETTVDNIQVFQLLPLSLSERVFLPMPSGSDARLRQTYADMIAYGDRKENKVQNKDNARLALKARLQMLMKEREQLMERVAERDKVLERFSMDQEEQQQVEQRLVEEIKRLTEARDQALVDIAELRADRLLDADEANRKLCIRIEILEAEVNELRSQKCETCGDLIGDEMPKSTDDKCCVVVSGLQTSLSSIYQSVLVSVFQEHSPETVKMSWSDDRLHAPGVTPTAHVHFATEQQTLAAASSAAGRDLFGSGPLLVRVAGGDPRLLVWRANNSKLRSSVAAEGGSELQSLSPTTSLSAVPPNIAPLAAQLSPPLDGLNVAKLREHCESPGPEPALPASVPLANRQPSLFPGSPFQSWRDQAQWEQLHMELTLAKTHNMRMSQTLARFTQLSRQFINVATRSIEREWWGTSDPADDDVDDQERDDKIFETIQTSTAEWMRATQEALQKKNAVHSPWTGPTGDLLQLLNSVRRLVMSTRNMARRGQTISGGVEQMAGVLADCGAKGQLVQADKVQQALDGFFRNVAGTRSVGVQVGFTAPRDSCVQTERMQLHRLPPPTRAATTPHTPRLCKGTNVRSSTPAHASGQLGLGPALLPRPPKVGGGGGVDSGRRAESSRGYRALLAMQQRVRSTFQEPLPDEAAAGATVRSDADSPRLPSPTSREKFLHSLRVRLHSPSQARRWPAATAERVQNIAVSLPRLSPA